MWGPIIGVYAETRIVGRRLTPIKRKNAKQTQFWGSRSQKPLIMSGFFDTKSFVSVKTPAHMSGRAGA
jgi:hypothetical protein